MANNDPNTISTIVMIDDDADFLHVMQRRLQSQRAELAASGTLDVRTFTDPVEALVNLPAEGICVIIVDYNMQSTTGLDWLPRFIKAGVGPVIMLTNLNDAKVAAEAFRTGAADFIAKGDVMADDSRIARAIRDAVHHYRLEERNALLTRQLKLMNIELEAKNKRLRELTETAHQFVDDVAHDFRTPLTVIQQYASIVAEGIGGPVTSRQREHLGTISEATRDLSEMVDDFLDSSKLRARSLSLDRSPHTAEEVLGSLNSTLDVRATPKQLTIEQSIEPGMPSIFADLSKSVRVLTNLVVNAIKVTPAGRTLRLFAKPTESGDVSIGVTDQGPGLAPDDLKIIFNRFQQLDDSQSSDSKGFGLGLSIVKQLTWLNLGKVEVQSELGVGSTFSFTVPALDERRILACYFDSIQSLEDAGDLWMLQIRTRNESLDATQLRRLISTSCYPMDLIFQDAGEHLLHLLGVSRDPEAWADRLRDSIARFGRSVGQRDILEVSIKAQGPWSRDMERSKLSDALIECTATRSYHA